MTRDIIIKTLHQLHDMGKSFSLSTDIPYGRGINGTAWRAYPSQGMVGDYENQITDIAFFPCEMSITYTRRFAENPTAKPKTYCVVLAYSSINAIETDYSIQEHEVRLLPLCNL